MIEKEERRRKNEEGRLKAQERRLHRLEVEVSRRQAEIKSIRMRYTGSEEDTVIPQGQYILVVSKNHKMAGLILYWLQGFGYESERAINIDQALEKIFKEKPLIIICDDIWPPEWSVRVLDILDGMVLDPAVSARMLLHDWIENPTEFRHPFDLVLIKPFVPQELISFVDRVYKAEASEVYQKALELRREHR